MESRKSVNAVIAVSIIAIIISLVALGIAFTGRGPAGQGVTPATQKFTLRIGEGKIIQEINGEDQLTGEYHRWEPSVLVVKKGDTVELTVINPRKKGHSFVLPDYGVNTGRIPGRTEEPDEAKRTVVVSFVADKAGVFSYICGIPYDSETGNCDPDHATMVGYLIVLDV